jgi:ribosome-binding ATPase YchF (GTP1/OBG family)
MVKRIKMADQSSADNAARLDRIVEKIDRMAEAIIALARAEEKIEALTRSFNDQNIVIANLAQRIDDVEGIVQANTSTVNVINKIFWIIISAAAVAVSGMLFLQVQ